jgi:hypothetical protein
MLFTQVQASNIFMHLIAVLFISRHDEQHSTKEVNVCKSDYVRVGKIRTI